MSTLTDEQRQRIEENRKLALARRAAKLQCSPSSAGSSVPSAVQATCSSSSSSHGSRDGRIAVPSHKNSTAVPKRAQSNNCERVNKTVTAPPTVHSTKTFYGDCLKGSFSLISKERFELIMEYHQPTIDIIKKIDGRQYDVTKKRWNFPIKRYHEVCEALKHLRPHVAIAELPTLVVDTFSNPSRHVDPSTVDLSKIAKSMLATLKEFQKDGVRFAVSRCGRVLIADDMGLGKTIQSLAIADYYQSDWPLLIVCPSSMRYQWQEEIEKHLPHIKRSSISVMRNGKETIDRCTKVLIVSYDLMASQKSKLLEKGFGVVIMDESHHLKNPKTLRTKAATELLEKSQRCILLSGTPVLSRPQELYCQLHAMKPRVFSKFMDFAIRYCDARKDRFGWNFSGSSNMHELGILLSELVMIRRLKADVLAELPPKRREIVVLEASGKKLSDTSEFARQLQKEGLKGMEKRSTMLQYFSETGKAKIKGICLYIQDMLENGEKFLVFCHHCQVMDAICQAIEEKKTDYIRIDGSVPSDVRKLLCDQFQSDERCMVAVLSIKAANTGLTLTAARLVIFAELYWNPGELTQAEDRVHRIGQQDSVLVQYLVQHGTADDYLWPLIQNKLDVLNKAGLSKDNFKEADLHVLKERQKNVLDYFTQGDDAELAHINIEEFEHDFTVDDTGPVKRQKCE